MIGEIVRQAGRIEFHLRVEPVDGELPAILRVLLPGATKRYGVVFAEVHLPRETDPIAVIGFEASRREVRAGMENRLDDPAQDGRLRNYPRFCQSNLLCAARSRYPSTNRQAICRFEQKKTGTPKSTAIASAL